MMATNASSSSKVWPAPRSLSESLWHSPVIFHCRFTDTAKRYILLQCYESLWGYNAQKKQQYFFHNQESFDDALARILNTQQQDTDMDASSNVWHSNNVITQPDLSSQRGRPCGHVFRKGEPVYRCRNCGLDDTCVFCSTCFHATDHDGHDVLFSISPGSGGCCDCGDPEAWKAPLQCQIHAVDPEAMLASTANHEELQRAEPELHSAMRETIATVLDFLLDTFTLAPEEVVLPTSTEQLLKEDRNERRVLDTLVSTSSAPSSSRTHPLPANDLPILDDDVDMDQAPADDEYACIAWNDEAHAFSHVLESIVSATGYDWEKAKRIVDAIHLHGREVIAMHTNIAELRKIATPLAAINLGVTIRPARSTFREQVAGLLVQWIKDLVCGPCRFFKTIPDGDSLVRDLVSQELCAEWEPRPSLAKLAARTELAHAHAHGNSSSSKPISQLRHPIVTLDGNVTPTAFAEEAGTIATNNTAVNEDIDMYDANQDMTPSQYVGSPNSDSASCSSLSPCSSHTQADIASIDWDPASMVHEYSSLSVEEEDFADTLTATSKPTTEGKKSVQETHQLAANFQLEFEQKLRIDYLMLYDMKLWKEIRIALREIYISTLASHPASKKILGKRLTRNYARLAESFLLKDREPENSIILFSVQLLTVPSVSDVLVNQYYFFGLVCSTLSAFFLTDHLGLLLPSELSRLPSRINCESRAFRTRRYFNAFHDLRYIMNVNMIKPVLAQDPLYLRQYLDLIGLFQGMNAQVCQKDTHVEYESEIWVNAFNVTLQIAKCCRQYADCFNALPVASNDDKLTSVRVLVRSINRVLKKIAEWSHADNDAQVRLADLDTASSISADALNGAPVITTTGTIVRPAATTTTVTTATPAAGTGASTTAPGDVSTDDKSKLIAGIYAQSHHTVVLPNMPPFKVIEYDVTSQPVSFHHPLHWLLAGLLEHAHLLTDDLLSQAGWTQGFANAISRFTQQADSTSDLLAILEYPLRTLVFSSQIRAGVWVRNGYGLRTQAHHYREISLRENTYDADLFLMQLGLVTLDPNLMLATMMDRFGLVGWFQGQTAHPQYDASQTVFMVEEILSLLIVCLCEHCNLVGASTEDRIRREIIHNLCTGVSSYSDLTKRIPERLVDHALFDRMLLELAHYKSPDGLHDAGRYELKAEFYPEIDSYFYHYSRNHREEAENVMRLRWKREHPDLPEETFFVKPKPNLLPEGPFRFLGSLLHTPVMVQMLAFCLWNARTSYESDTILDKALYMTMLAVSDVNHRPDDDGFYRACIDRFYSFENQSSSKGADATESPSNPTTMSLFQVLTVLRQDDACKVTHPRLDFILDCLAAHPVTELTVEQWRVARLDAVAAAASASAGSDDQRGNGDDASKDAESEYERKKRAAKERQAKIMAQFAQAQSQFLEMNEGLYEDDEETNERDMNSADSGEDATKSASPAVDHHDRLCAYPVGTCIVCQEEVHERSAPYGLLGLMQTSNILRETPMDQSQVYQDILHQGPTLSKQWPDNQILPDNASTMSGFPSQLHKTGLYASTCGHLMHIKCFDEYCASIDSRHASQLTRNHPENRTRKEFMCPLCKSLGNMLLPLFWKGKKVSKTRCFAKASPTSYQQFLRQDAALAMQNLHHLLSPPSATSASTRASSMAMAVSSMISSRRQSAGASKFKETLTTWLSGEDRPGSSSTPTSFPSTSQPSTSYFGMHSSPMTFGGTSSVSFASSVPLSSGLSTASASLSNSTPSSSAAPPSSTLISDAPIQSVPPLESDLLHASATTHMAEIKSAYTRLTDVLAIIYDQVSDDDAVKELSVSCKHVDLLWGLLGYTINAVEISTRGQDLPLSHGAETDDVDTAMDQDDLADDGPLPPTGTLFDTVAPQTQMLLRLLGDTVAAYTHLLLCEDTISLQRIQLMCLGRLRQLFGNTPVAAAPSAADDAKLDLVYENMPLLEDDPFMTLVELAMYLNPLMPDVADISNLIRILLLAELAKVVVSLLEHDLQDALPSLASPLAGNAKKSEQDLPAYAQASDAEKHAMRSFIQFVAQSLNMRLPPSSDVVDALWVTLVEGFGLPFLRRSLLLLIIRFGYHVQPSMVPSHAKSEFQQLLALLHLPSMDEILSLNDQERVLVQQWCQQHRREVQRRQQVLDIARTSLPNTMPSSSPNITLDLPTPLYLVSLPSRLDRLFDESLKRVCSKCSTVPNDPALCLFCGTFVCCQSFCCSEDEEGECNLHTLGCGGDIGIFLSVKRCVLIFLHNGNGWFMNAPYLDAHGEVDQNLRRGRPQFLNTKRYSEIRRLWLQHQIPIYVARQIEATYDIGGWSTL
ncbi:hypothetical protein DM01DRAFT_1382719 [Hesseltinella vesiculosa]|uniref:E3 ubiquitin-protein ligase n=1 Tax=Hesseltinella vesiculosa TaxID=101127 RepID=A0A1X2GJW8_9FUNG|nr:hypothetical protein DM01DRAFT_1382719 [Hesseltinella vesiculosa]